MDIVWEMEWRVFAGGVVLRLGCGLSIAGIGVPDFSICTRVGVPYQDEGEGKPPCSSSSLACPPEALPRHQGQSHSPLSSLASRFQTSGQLPRAAAVAWLVRCLLCLFTGTLLAPNCRRACCSLHIAQSAYRAATHPGHCDTPSNCTSTTTT